MISICYESCKDCNLNCDYCISSDNKNDKEGANYKDIIKKILSLDPQRIVISGGEPLMDSSLIDKLKEIKVHSKNIYISLSTNGSIDYDHFTELKKYIDCIDISLPALDHKIYKTMRGCDQVNIVKSNIKRAKEAGLYVKISFILTKVNKSELFKVLNYAKRTKINEVRIGRFLPLRNAKQCKDKYEIKQADINELMEKVYKQEYDFDIVPPIDNIEKIEEKYLNIDFRGEFFLPTRNGKKYLSEEKIQEIMKGEQYEIFRKVKLIDCFEKYFRPLRIRESEKRYFVDEFYSDRMRIIYYPTFRRMQQKAQVFSLEENPNVRSRLTHSIEVSDIGRRLALRIATELCSEGLLKEQYIDCLIAIVENACLLHDIGNPPFGHFGETAIKKWWKDNSEGYIKEHNERAKQSMQKTINFSTDIERTFLKDFEEFDGNPQGLRNVLRICKNLDPKDAMFQSGLNLSYPTILCDVKYIRCAGECRGNITSSEITKKAGYFQSEKNIMNQIYLAMGMYPERMRYPFVYIMEAADDIAYCLSDIADGIEKKIITLDFFVNKFKEIWKNNGYKNINEIIPDEVVKIIRDPNKKILEDFNNLIGSKWKEIMINEVVEEYVKNIYKYCDGNIGSVADNLKSGLTHKILTVTKIFSRKYIYRAPEVEEIEIAGYSIISGLLDVFGMLLKLPYSEFSNFIDSDKNPAGKEIDLEWRIFNRLSNTCVESYKQQLLELKEYYKQELTFENVEWWLRVHLIIDHISGMTDEYALKTFQNCHGIDIGLY